MNFIVSFMGAIFSRYFQWIVAKVGLQMGINLAMVTVWLTMTASFTAVIRTCASATGSCGGFASNTSSLSDWLKFGLSLVPIELVQMITCLISIHVSGWAMVQLWHLISMKYKISP